LGEDGPFWYCLLTPRDAQIQNTHYWVNNSWLWYTHLKRLNYEHKHYTRNKMLHYTKINFIYWCWSLTGNNQVIILIMIRINARNVSNYYRRGRSSTGYWLLLRDGIVQSVLCNYDHFLVYCAPHLSSNHSRFVHQGSLLWFQQRRLVAKRRETELEISTKFCLSISLSYLKGSLICRKILKMGWV
jgi:hypothetical protein